MSFFGNNNCGCGNGSLFNGNDTILWFIILFLLIFGNNCCEGNNNNNCGCSNDCC